MLDSALWRRFEAIVPFPLPKEQDPVLMLRAFFRDCGHLALPVSAGGQNQPVAGGSKPASGEAKFLASAGCSGPACRGERPHRERTTSHPYPR
jgi:hypothetical protein